MFVPWWALALVAVLVFAFWLELRAVRKEQRTFFGVLSALGHAAVHHSAAVRWILVRDDEILDRKTAPHGDAKAATDGVEVARWRALQDARPETTAPASSEAGTPGCSSPPG